MAHFSASARLNLVGGLATILALLLVSCDGDYRPRAVGKEGEVTVVMDSVHWTGPVGEAFRKSVTPWVETVPQPERYFDIRHYELSDERTYSSIQDLKNVVFVAPLSDSSNEATFLRRRLSEDARAAVLDGQSAVVSKPNLWRRSQRIFFVTAATPDAVIESLQERGHEIREEIKAVTLQRMQREMYSRARRTEVEDSLMNRHDFAVNVQHDFQIAVDTTTESTGFVWLRRLLAKTRREFFVYYEEDVSPSQLTPEWIYAKRDSLTRRYLRGNVAGFVRIDYRRALETRESDFVDRYGYESRGLWHMVRTTDEEGEFMSVGGGGPFVTYAFYDRPSNRLYLLDGSVFAPDYDKLTFLRQMEVMAHTFRTKTDVETAADSAQIASSE